MNRQGLVDIGIPIWFYDQYYFDDSNLNSIFTLAMSMQPYFVSLLGTLTPKEREHCRELARKNLPSAVRRYVITLLESKPEAIEREEEKFLQGYSESGKRWIRRTAQEFLESALYNLYGTAYELRILLNQVHLAIARSHPTSPFLMPLKRRMKEVVKPINLFFAPLPWIMELSYLAISYPGSSIIDLNHIMTFDDALRLVSLDSKRLETIRFAVEHDPFIGENNPNTEQVIKKLEDIHKDLELFHKTPFHKSIISLYGMMALIYEELGMIQNSRSIVTKFIAALPPLIDFISSQISSQIKNGLKEWLDIATFLATVSLQVVYKSTGWEDEKIDRLKNHVIELISFIRKDKNVVSTGEIPLMARLSNWLATHGFTEEANMFLKLSGWFSAKPESAFRPIERIDLSVAHFWSIIQEKDWSGALRIVAKLEQIIPQRPIYYYLTELLRFVVALLKGDYELLSSTAERVYHWNRRHPNFFPTLGKTLRYIAIRAPRIVYPSDWNEVIERIVKMYEQYPFYLTNVEKHAKLLSVIIQKSNHTAFPEIKSLQHHANVVDVKPLETVLNTLIDYIISKSTSNEQSNHTDS